MITSPVLEHYMVVCKTCIAKTLNLYLKKTYFNGHLGTLATDKHKYNPIYLKYSLVYLRFDSTQKRYRKKMLRLLWSVECLL